MKDKISVYRETLKNLQEWDAYLLSESCLPGARANLELAYAVMYEARRAQIERWLRLNPSDTPADKPDEFLPVCGVLGLGRLLAEGDLSLFARLRAYASDPRWRVREAVAMALQHVGDTNMSLLLEEMQHWAEGSSLEQRAAAAALAEPRLLKNPEHAHRVLSILDYITAAIPQRRQRDDKESLRVLKKGLGYCWSVAVAALPAEGLPMMEKWFASQDHDILWVMRENLKKARLERVNANWVAHWKSVLGV